jgi:transcriptional regulator with XRE-family HTH domain
MDRLDQYIKMRRLGYSQQEIARRTGTTQATVSKYFNGNSSNSAISKFVTSVIIRDIEKNNVAP